VPDQSIAKALELSATRCRQMDAPLVDRLKAFADDVAALSPEFAAIVERMIGVLRKAGVGEHAPQPGEPMPSFVLPDQDGHLVGLHDFLGKDQVVLSFHRGGWCPYCRINAEALARIEPEVKARRGRVVVITPDVEQFNAELRADTRATFPVLTDLDNAFAMELSLAFKVPEEKRQAMTSAGWDIASSQNSDAWILPIPATFVIGTDGIVKSRFLDPDYRKRMTTEDIVAALE